VGAKAAKIVDCAFVSQLGELAVN